MESIRVTIVDDHSLFRNGLKILLKTTQNINVIYEAASGEDFLKKMAVNESDIVLMDIDLPGIDGIETTKRAISKNPDLKIIALSMFSDEEYYYKMIEAGAKGFLLKDSDIAEVKQAILSVNEGKTHFSEQILFSLIKNKKSAQITETNECNLSIRENEVLVEICKGYSNQEIAEKLNISKRTVDKHRSHLLEKTNSKNTASLVIFALKNKLIDL